MGKGKKQRQKFISPAPPVPALPRMPVVLRAGAGHPSREVAWLSLPHRHQAPGAEAQQDAGHGRAVSRKHHGLRAPAFAVTKGRESDRDQPAGRWAVGPTQVSIDSGSGKRESNGMAPGSHFTAALGPHSPAPNCPEAPRPSPWHQVSLPLLLSSFCDLIEHQGLHPCSQRPAPKACVPSNTLQLCPPHLALPQAQAQPPRCLPAWEGPRIPPVPLQMAQKKWRLNHSHLPDTGAPGHAQEGT